MIQQLFKLKVLKDTVLGNWKPQNKRHAVSVINNRDANPSPLPKPHSNEKNNFNDFHWNFPNIEIRTMEVLNKKI